MQRFAVVFCPAQVIYQAVKGPIEGLGEEVKSGLIERVRPENPRIPSQTRRRRSEATHVISTVWKRCCSRPLIGRDLQQLFRLILMSLKRTRANQKACVYVVCAF